ncbi:hypothetical protein ALI144C_44940 [Actinosynnema sp. ALI-1.44]|uniref:AAA family ATPase n=1 Tax=Actinosynnema sp. ALI-1.44 TaxID=1933779 RepID=UPI00097BC472|nr:AAA family ATPase [Actinosynnema sp. ALI-1.44]ONI73100.1 hypothetical protein ALI144C_44940 [Actinosynnema sp. ALI-1.44]
MTTRDEALRLLRPQETMVAADPTDPYVDVPHPADSEPAAPEPTEDRFPRVDWHAAFALDLDDIDWLPGQLMERGQQTALVGSGKSGKSIFVLDWIYRAITERPFLGDRARPPIRVLYFDRENGLRDIITRLRSFGVTEQELDLFSQRFDYRMFPRFSGALDASTIAAAELLALVDELQPDVVVLDTVSRFISGNENDSQTWLEFYRLVHAPLKARGVACVRLDHTGKDDGRGSRGSSAKSQDVDHVWELTAGEGVAWVDKANDTETITTHLKLKRTHTRTGVGDDTFTITRRGIRKRGGVWLPGGTRHELTAWTAGAPDEPALEGTVEWLMQQLDAAGVPRDWGNRKVKPECARLGIRARSEVVEEAVRRRKTDTTYRSVTFPADVPQTVFSNEAGGTFPGNVPPRSTNFDVSADQTFPGNVGGTSEKPDDFPTFPQPYKRLGNVGERASPPPKDGPHGTCSVCGSRMVILYSGQDRHPLCGDPPAPTDQEPAETPPSSHQERST